LAAAILIVAAVLRIAFFSPGLEYDEIWTIRHYSVHGFWTILNDLATPNNHPLNSLFIRWTGFWSSSAWAIRAPSFCAGLAVVGLTGYLAFLLFHSRFVTLSSMILTAANPGLILYSVTARGYSMQTALILLFAVLAVLSYRTRRMYPLILLPSVAILAELSLPTSVLWLFPIALVHGIVELVRAKRDWKKLLPSAVSYTVTGILLLSWILLHYYDFRAGQSFGKSVAGVSVFLNFAGSVLNELACWKTDASLVLLLSILICPVFQRRDRLKLCGLIFLLFFPLFAALFTLGGPSRVYLPSVPFLAVIVAVLLPGLYRMVRIGFKNRNARRILFCLFCLFPLVIAYSALKEGKKYWKRIDWIERFSAIKQLPSDQFLCIPATETYPAFWNNGPAIIRDYLLRFSEMKPGSLFVTVDRPSGISGMTPSGDMDEITLSDSPRGEGDRPDGMQLFRRCRGNP